MTATLRWNRLSINADGDAAFKAAVEENFSKLLKLPFDELELDFGACKNLGEPAFQVIGPELAKAAGGKKLAVRIPEELASYFQGTGLHGLIEVSVIEHMTGAVKPGTEDSTPDLDDLEPDEEEDARDETHPPGDDINQTKIQTRAANGGIVDEEDGHRYLIGDEIVIGREPPSEPVFAIPTISKRHFRVFRQGPGYFIEDMRSTNGTYLNGNPLTQPQPLGEGDEIVVAITLKHPDGAKRFKFSLKD
ncbi:MAG: FHA domain-containing protein [Planctomycetes bacterium]|nr:FHA domain-containing protein [Planctomycetota bacterium]MCA8936170.1 FHA domain-containing protein [Planctomycetota bacterium]MCA8947123.1 FHA domain-containing protein [Planctomycetota bacterium]